MSDIVERLRRPPFEMWETTERKLCEDAAAEIERLNKWADGFSDAQLKERQLCEARIAEMQRTIDKLSLALMMIREGCAEPAKFAGERIAALSHPKGTT